MADFVSKQESYFTYTEDATPSPVDHDVHFRPGIGVGGIETYTPRALIYDLKGRRGVGRHGIGNSANTKFRGDRRFWIHAKD